MSDTSEIYANFYIVYVVLYYYYYYYLEHRENLYYTLITKTKGKK